MWWSMFVLTRGIYGSDSIFAIRKAWHVRYHQLHSNCGSCILFLLLLIDTRPTHSLRWTPSPHFLWIKARGGLFWMRWELASWSRSVQDNSNTSKTLTATNRAAHKSWHTFEISRIELNPCHGCTTLSRCWCQWQSRARNGCQSKMLQKSICLDKDKCHFC